MHFEGTTVINIIRLVPSHVKDKNFSNIEMRSRILVVCNNWCFIRIVQKFRDDPLYSFRLSSCYDQLIFGAWCKVRRFIICGANAIFGRHRRLARISPSYFTIRLRPSDFYEIKWCHLRRQLSISFPCMTSNITSVSKFFKNRPPMSQSRLQKICYNDECYAANQITGFGLKHTFVSALQSFGYGCT